MNTLEQEVIEVRPINTRSAEVAAEEAQACLMVARMIVIKSDDQRRGAAMAFNELRERMKIVEEERKKITTPLNAALDAVNALFKKPYTMLKEARDITEKACIAYDNEKERARQEEERRLREIAAKEEARQRQIKEEQERVWREKAEKARQEEIRLQNEGKAAEAEKARQEAARAQAKAEERAQQAAEVFVPAPVIAQEKVKVAGTKDVTRYDFEITDMKLIPHEWFVLDEAKIAKFATATKGTVTIPGVRIFAVKKLS
jgi:hypothetical protein